MTKAEALKIAGERAKAKGFTGRGFALFAFMTDEERKAYLAEHLPQEQIKYTKLGHMSANPLKDRRRP